jgi:hypothetical protein
MTIGPQSRAGQVEGQGADAEPTSMGSDFRALTMGSGGGSLSLCSYS